MSNQYRYQNVRTKDVPLYNSRLVKNYVEYLNEHMPNVDVASLLKYAEITSYQLEDGGHWFTQSQINLFHEIMHNIVGDPDIARKVGRNVPFSKATGAVTQYVLGFITPSTAYSTLGKL